MSHPAQDDTDYVRANVQWRVGIASLRRLRNLVDGYERDEQFKRRTAKYVAVGFTVALGLLLITVLVAPATIQNLFRSLS